MRASEIRQRLNEIAALDTEAVTEEIRNETDKLTAELRTVETQFRAAVAAEETELRAVETDPGEPAPEVAEIRSLQDSASFTRYLRAATDGDRLDGAERELSELRGLSDTPNRVPWDVLLPPPGRSAAELRADAVTPGPSSGNPTNQAGILQRVFARAAVARLGVYMPSVGVGVASYPLINAGQTAAFVDKGAEKDATAGAIGSNLLEPKRLQARVQFQLEDELTTAGLDAALAEDLRLAVNDRLDAQLVGLGTAQVSGVLAAAADGGIGDYADPSDVVTFAAAAEQAARGVDGMHAGGEDECSWIVGTASYAKLAGLIQDATSATQRLRMLLRDFMASANIPAAASNVQSGILSKLGAVDGWNAVCPIWEGLKLIRDEITNADSGKVQITAVAFHNFRVIRPSGYVRTKLKLA